MADILAVVGPRELVSPVMEFLEQERIPSTLIHFVEDLKNMKDIDRVLYFAWDEATRGSTLNKLMFLGKKVLVAVDEPYQAELDNRFTLIRVTDLDFNMRLRQNIRDFCRNIAPQEDIFSIPGVICGKIIIAGENITIRDSNEQLLGETAINHANPECLIQVTQGAFDLQFILDRHVIIYGLKIIGDKERLFLRRAPFMDGEIPFKFNVLEVMRKLRTQTSFLQKACFALIKYLESNNKLGPRILAQIDKIKPYC